MQRQSLCLGGGLQRLLRRPEGFSGLGTHKSLVWQWPKGGLVLLINEKFLMAAWGPDSETSHSVYRCMSGFTDAF
jgi:hypothetical protein